MKQNELFQIGRDAYTVDGIGKKTRYSRVSIPKGGGLGEGDKVVIFLAREGGKYELLPGDVVVRKGAAV
jgi:hypothetical protein